MQRFGVPYYAKIDIEGSDITCLRGFEGYLACPRYVSVEVDFYRLNELFECLTNLGYSKFALVGQAGIERQIAPKPALEGRYVPFQFSNSSGLFGRELPAEWVSAKEARRACDRVVSQYRYAGIVRRLEGIVPLRPALQSFLDRHLPLAGGWYDIHAMQ